MYDTPPNYPQAQTAAQFGMIGGSMHNPTVGENIDNQIKHHQMEVERLLAIRKQLEASGMLTMHIHDLRQAMAL